MIPLEIKSYIHCKRCFTERPKEVIRPQDWSQLDVGFTPKGLQVWCRRHKINVLYVDFEGHKHPAEISI